jgi:hypothetical protein
VHNVFITGTILATTNEENINAGGKVITLTITDGKTWAATLGDDNSITTAFLDGISSDGVEAFGWNNVVTLTFADVTRISDTVVEIILPAFPTYNISVVEHISILVPSIAFATAGGGIPATRVATGSLYQSAGFANTTAVTSGSLQQEEPLTSNPDELASPCIYIYPVIIPDWIAPFTPVVTFFPPSFTDVSLLGGVVACAYKLPDTACAFSDPHIAIAECIDDAPADRDSCEETNPPSHPRRSF